MAIPDKLMPLGELFEQATRTGVEELGLADRLLAEIKAGLMAYGYRRQFTYPNGGDRKERLPRDTHRQPIPNFIWQYLETVSAALDSKWFDDPDEPDDWAIMDWISGQFETIDFDTQNDERVFVYFHSIAIEAKVGRRLLAELTGEPRRRPGRPKGPRDKWERHQARKGFDLIRKGDQRPDIDIAAELANGKLDPDLFANQKRRILAGIRMLIDEAENSDPE